MWTNPDPVTIAPLQKRMVRLVNQPLTCRERWTVGNPDAAGLSTVSSVGRTSKAFSGDSQRQSSTARPKMSVSEERCQGTMVALLSELFLDRIYRRDRRRITVAKNTMEWL